MRPFGVCCGAFRLIPCLVYYRGTYRGNTAVSVSRWFRGWLAVAPPLLNASSVAIGDFLFLGLCVPQSDLPGTKSVRLCMGSPGPQDATRCPGVVAVEPSSSVLWALPVLQGNACGVEVKGHPIADCWAGLVHPKRSSGRSISYLILISCASLDLMPSQRPLMVLIDAIFCCPATSSRSHCRSNPSVDRQDASTALLISSLVNPLGSVHPAAMDVQVIF